MLLTDVEELGIDDQIISFESVDVGTDEVYLAFGQLKGDLIIKGFKKKAAKAAYDYASSFSKKSKVFDERFELYYPISCLRFFRDSVRERLRS